MTAAAPIKPSGALYSLFGNLAPDGAVVKLAGTERTRHQGPARVFDTERECVRAVRAGEIEPGRRWSCATRARRAARGCARC